MKKMFALILALVMVLSLSATALAVSTGDHSSDVTVEIKPYAGPEVFAIDLVWGNMDFVYEFTGWDEEHHVYTGSWDHTETEIKLTNNSNVDVTVDPAEPEDQNSDDEVSFVLSSTAATTLEIGDVATYKLTVRGEPKENVSVERYTAAKLKISIAKAN